MMIGLSPLIALVIVGVEGVSFSVPAKVGNGGYAYAPVDPAPIGLSFEFFEFPSYFTNVTATKQCLSNWEALTGTWPPIRIGGTTQDRATYDPSTSAYVVYSVSSSTDAPSALTFGPEFMTLAGTYEGSVVLGLNRGHDNLTNTVAAAKVAVSEMDNLLAIELGNEPEYWASASQPIATSGWSTALDAASENDWDIRVGSSVGKTDIIQAGNFNDGSWTDEYLISTENSTVKKYIHDYAHHNYPGGSVQSLMTHSTTVSNVAGFDDDVAAALDVGKDYVLGETNSVSGGGASSVSPTFGAALWTMDYSIRAVYSNISRIYFHHGTLGACYYCFYGRYSMGAPYYGAYAATAFLADASYVTALDDGTIDYAAYVSYDSNGVPLRALLYNSDYYAGSGNRNSTTFTLAGLTVSSIKAKRLTATSALSRQDQGGNPSFGGQYFNNGTCVIGGTETYETSSVSSGSASFALKATEALLVYLQ